jgi:hypothetical protein
MTQALHDRQVDTALAAQLAQAVYGTADWMRNKGG